MTREEAIECLIDAKEEFAYFPNHCVAFDMAIEALKREQRKTANWIPKQFGDCECSNCHEEYGVCGGLLGDYNYCPNCGAKVDGKYE